MSRPRLSVPNGKRGGGRLQALQQMRGGGILRIRRDPRAEQRDDDDREHDHAARHRRQVAREFLQDQHRAARFAALRR